MTDQEFQVAINTAQEMMRNYYAALRVAENEYERRYGHNPSDRDNDEWIDSMHVSGAPMTVKMAKESADRCM